MGCMTKVKELFAAINEQYPTQEQACYIKYRCYWCDDTLFLVEPHTHQAQGGIMQIK